MLKMKRGVAVALAATMVLGSTAFAADTNSGTTTGTGTSEGHVDKKATNVVLPTETTDYTASTFAYTMDPERLISGTSGGKYETGSTFPEKTSDTGVYFLTADKKYENNSKALKVENQSSHAIDLTVKAEAVSAATDIPLVAKDAVASADKASLYLGLVVGNETAVAISKDTAASKTVTVDGQPDNFGVTVKADKNGYEYRALTLDEYKAIEGHESATELPAWKSETFKLEGSVTSKEITDATTAPNVKVTWSWVDPTAAPADAAPSIATADQTKTVAADTAVTIPVNLGSGNKVASDVTSVKWKEGNREMLNVNNMATYADGVVTITAASVNYLLRNDSNFPATMVITFDDAENTSIEVTLNK